VSAVPIPQLHYRRMRMSDLPEIAHLEKALYTFPWSLGNFRDSITAGYDCWTATHGETVIGYAVLMIALDEAHLLNIAVAAEWQNQGIGHLYRTVGFQQIAIRPDYYPALHGREDALFLGLTL
jgi:ribosomal-protein-alanine N-acetyltransferase